MQDDTELVVRNVTHMLTCRGINEEIVKLESPSTDNTDHVFATSSRSIVFVVSSTDKTRVTLQRSVMEENKDSHHFIFINPEGHTGFAKKEARQLEGKRVEYFRTCFFKFCFTDHVLYCEHRRIPDADAFLKRRKWTVSKLPTLRYNDAVSRYMDFKEGDLVEIKMPHFSGLTQSQYRVVRMTEEK